MSIPTYKQQLAAVIVRKILVAYQDRMPVKYRWHDAGLEHTNSLHLNDTVLSEGRTAVK